MPRIIDLKNKQVPEHEPADKGELNVQNQTQSHWPHEKISWSEQFHYQSNLKAAIATAVVLFIIASLVQIFQKNIITTIFFALLGTLILLNIYKKPRVGNFEVGPTGIKINTLAHNYKDLTSFWIEYDPDLGIKELSLQAKKWYMPYIKIPLGAQNPVQLRLVLLEFLPEVEHKDTLVEILTRKLGI